MASLIQEMTEIDGLDRSDAEVLFHGPLDEDPEEATERDPEEVSEDWRARAAEASAYEEREKAGKLALQAVIADEVAKEVAKILAAMNPPTPAKAMISKVHDRFMTGGNVGTPLKHYRCESAHSVKLAELDMDLLEAYQSGEKDRPTNEKGRPYSAVELSVIPGKWIEWVETHAYPTTDNQVRNIERVKDLALKGLPGGMPGIYEDTGGVQDWRCFVCHHQPQFTNRETHDAHMLAVHGVVTPAVTS